MKSLVRMAVVASLVLFTVASMGCGKKADKVLAVVGGKKITTKEFNQAMKNLPENYKVLAESYKGKHKILENLIKKELLVLEAEKRGYPKDAEIKKKIKDQQIAAKKELNDRIAELELQRNFIERQVYENALLNELNTRLKSEGITGVEITPQEISDYYSDYVRKLKILNPAAAVPSLETVTKQIHAILVEERLIKQLEKQSSVEVKETSFKELYGDENKDIVIEDSSK